MKFKIVLLIICAALQACSKIDDYMLGKDNTPEPKALQDVKSQVKVSKNWSVPVGRAHRSSGYMKLKPVIVGNTVYTADASGLVQAVNKKSGAIEWSTQLKHGVVSGPAVTVDYLAFGTNASTLMVISRKSGKELWDNKVSSEILSQPVFSHHAVIAKTIDGNVYAYKVADGKALWKAEHGAPNFVLKASSSPIVLGNLILVGFSDGKMDAYDVQSGNLVWQRSIVFSTGASDVERLVDIGADPIVKNKIAYIASYQGDIGALSLDNGQFLWKRPGSVYKNMVLSGNTLYLTDSNDVVWSLDSQTGNVNWKQTAFKARGLTEPVVRGKEIVVGDRQGYLHILETQTGKVIARSELSGGIAVSPNVSGRSIYVITENGILNKLSVG